MEKASVDPHYPYHMGDVDGTTDGITFYKDGEYRLPSIPEQEEIENLLTPYVNRDNRYLSKVAKVVEVETVVGLGGWGGSDRRPVVFIPEEDTMYVGSNDSSHASVIAVIDERLLAEYPDSRGYTADGK